MLQIGIIRDYISAAVLGVRTFEQNLGKEVVDEGNASLLEYFVAFRAFFHRLLVLGL